MQCLLVGLMVWLSAGNAAIVSSEVEKSRPPVEERSAFSAAALEEQQRLVAAGPRYDGP